MNTLFAKPVSTMLESFLDEESHTHQLCIGLFHQVDDTLAGISVGQEVIDEQLVLSLLVESFGFSFGNH